MFFIFLFYFSIPILYIFFLPRAQTFQKKQVNKSTEAIVNFTQVPETEWRETHSSLLSEETKHHISSFIILRAEQGVEWISGN